MIKTAIDYDAIRNRLEFAADALGIPWAEVEPIIKASDAALAGETETQATFKRLLELCIAHGVSFDWLFLGDLRGVLRFAAARMKES